jgi:hypothetical protein
LQYGGTKRRQNRKEGKGKKAMRKEVERRKKGRIGNGEEGRVAENEGGSSGVVAYSWGVVGGKETMLKDCTGERGDEGYVLRKAKEGRKGEGVED